MRDVPSRLMRAVPVPRRFTDPRLLLGQCCGYDLVYGFAESLSLVATPRYGAPGCIGSDYRSFVLVRDTSPAGDVEIAPRQCLRDQRLQFALGHQCAESARRPFSRDGQFFSAVKVSGGHLASLALLRAGEADVMAMDSVLHAPLGRHRPAALEGTRILTWSDPAPAPPFITSAGTDPVTIDRLRTAFASAMSDPGCADARSAMQLDGIDVLPLEAYGRIVETEGFALSHGYRELHATAPAIRR